MTSGDKSAQSYGWSKTLDAPVNDGEGVKIPTPDLDIRYTDTEHAQVTVSSTGAVYEHDDDRVTTAFDETEGAQSCEVVNHTGHVWPAGTSVYVFCPHLLAEGDNEWDLKGLIYDLQQQMSALDERVTALEEGQSGQKTLPEPPKAPPAAHQTNIPPAKPPNSPQRGPIPPPKGR